MVWNVRFKRSSTKSQDSQSPLSLVSGKRRRSSRGRKKGFFFVNWSQSKRFISMVAGSFVYSMAVISVEKDVKRQVLKLGKLELIASGRGNADVGWSCTEWKI